MHYSHGPYFTQQGDLLSFCDKWPRGAGGKADFATSGKRNHIQFSGRFK